MIEAAVAYYNASGKRKLLDVMRRYADYIATVFGSGEGMNPSFDGHPEIELALNRLADSTGEKKYSVLANHFVDARGFVKDYHLGRAAMDGMIPKSRWFLSDYYLADVPVRKMQSVKGHSVRAMYLYCAMADYCRGSVDKEMFEALRNIWKSAVSRQMYITAGLGSQSHGERFTLDYDLPNDSCYTETCASIGLAMWAFRMLLIDPRSEYADVIERAMYNGILSGISLEGTKYFYVNPLELQPAVASYRQDLNHVSIERVGWFDCACCPTNVARFIASIGGYIATVAEEKIWIHQYVSSNLELKIQETAVRIVQTTDYPWKGNVRILVDPDNPIEFSIHVRIPSWCESATIGLNGTAVHQPVVKDGYAILSRVWNKGDSVELEMNMPVRYIRANSRVRENAGKIAVQRGPIIYCVEEHDNGANLHLLSINTSVEPKLLSDGSLPHDTVALELSAFREALPSEDAMLYSDYREEKVFEPCSIKAIPYHQWGNRTCGCEMTIWLRPRQT